MPLPEKGKGKQGRAERALVSPCPALDLKPVIPNETSIAAGNGCVMRNLSLSETEHKL